MSEPPEEKRGTPSVSAQRPAGFHAEILHPLPPTTDLRSAMHRPEYDAGESPDDAAVIGEIFDVASAADWDEQAEAEAKKRKRRRQPESDHGSRGDTVKDVVISLRDLRAVANRKTEPSRLNLHQAFDALLFLARDASLDGRGTSQLAQFVQSHPPQYTRMVHELAVITGLPVPRALPARIRNKITSGQMRKHQERHAAAKAFSAAA